MKKTEFGLVMLDIYEENGKLIYRDKDEESSRLCCQYGSYPTYEDLTDQTDWMIDSEYLEAFLALPDDALIERASHITYGDLAALKPAYRVSEIKAFVVYHIEAVALVQRGNNSQFSSKMYAWGSEVPQSFWEALYPNTYKRAIAKVENDLFSNGSTWYFLGQNSYDLYRVSSIVIACDIIHGEMSARWLRGNGAFDGLKPDSFSWGDESCSCGHFKLAALEGTIYPQEKLDTPAKLLAAAYDVYDLERFLTKTYYGVLTDEEYKCAVVVNHRKNLAV